MTWEIYRNIVPTHKNGIREAQRSGTDEVSKGFDSKEGFLQIPWKQMQNF